MLENVLGRKTIAWIIIHVILYFLCSFIAWDLNPLHWAILNSGAFGRIILVVVEIWILVEWVEEFEDTLFY